MVNIFVFGATGFIGGSAAQALRRAGHNVYGLARDDKKAKLLASQEITPVVGEIAKPDTWLPTAAVCDVVIDISPSYGGITEGILSSLLSSPKVSGREKHHPKQAFIYVSGIWVHGNGTQKINDLEVPGTKDAKNQPMEIVGWRPALEQKILDARDKLDVFIVRPALLFGYGASAIGAWWGPLLGAAMKGEKEVSVEAAPEVNVTCVHQADLADAFVKLVDRIELLSGLAYPVFDIIGSLENVDTILKATARAMGFKGELKYAQPSQAFSAALTSASNVDGGRARRYLDWSPKHVSLVGDIDIYVKAFMASASQ